MTFIGPRGSKFTYVAKFSMFYYLSSMVVSLLAPIFILRPKNVVNCKLGGWFIGKCTYLLGISWELRGSHLLRDNVGGIIISNHQSSIDILGMFNLWQFMDRATAIAKKEILYIFPLGPVAWLAGITYIDRKSPKDSYKTLSKCVRLMKDDKIKIFMYPEGRRNDSRSGFLPFKKGAFKTAIHAKVPITPIVQSPLYFVDPKKHIFDSGHVILSVLDPIKTDDLTDEDTDMLMNKCRDLMLTEFRKLSSEIESKLSNMSWMKEKRSGMYLKD
ncbi:1-acyl-sn-glycerol-3-phosphate acyltransferase alpha-like isoform X2 [Phlebotomus argentipes]|nr:1-acyl-sn-glycerol-3-phosphate acyltransferase alpha-like isoform X2 [Phlebotomus argentipes]